MIIKNYITGSGILRMGKGMKVKYTKLFDRIYPYLLTGVIFLIFGISHQSVWFQKDVINLYIRQALIWFPAVLAILLLALGNEFYVAVGEQIAFGVCIAGCLKKQVELSGESYFCGNIVWNAWNCHGFQ